MPPHLPLALTLLVALFLCCTTAARADKEEVTLYLQDMLRQEWNKYGSSQKHWTGGIGVQIRTLHGSHYASIGLEHEENDIHFRGGSVAKTFTAAACLLLQQRGLLHLDDAIVENIPGRNIPYVPDTPDFDIPFKRQITIRQLLGHVAGVFDVDNDTIPENIDAPYAGQRYVLWKEARDFTHTFSFAELVGVAARHKLSYFFPGVAYHYSNTGYSLLGEIIQRVSGMRYAAFLRANLLDPNGLDRTFFPDQGDQVSLPQPAPDTAKMLEDGALEDFSLFNLSAHVAEGNLVTTPSDLTNWTWKLFRAEAGIRRELMLQMTDVEQFGRDYGLGCNYNRAIGYGHVGALPGYMSVAGYLPSAEVAVVVFANMINADDLEGQANMLYEVGRRAREIVLSLSPETDAASF